MSQILFILYYQIFKIFNKYSAKFCHNFTSVLIHMDKLTRNYFVYLYLIKVAINLHWLNLYTYKYALTV